MSILRVSNPKKLRRLSAVLGKPVLAAWARWFKRQTVLLVFTATNEAWAVSPDGDVKPVEGVALAADGCGVRWLASGVPVVSGGGPTIVG